MQEFSDTLTQCPHCGYYLHTAPKEIYHLIPGTILNGRYIVGTSIGSGGFGITYIAWDALFEKRIAIKEFFPTELATRLDNATTVFPYDGIRSDYFQQGLIRFLDEARRLAQLNTLPNIVHIYDMFEGNGTAYIIMDYVDGATLKDVMLQFGGPVPYHYALNIMLPVLRSLDLVHAQGIVHRDIAPDNIKYDGKNVTLLDFGSARTETALNSKSLSVIVKSGYAPEEQYRNTGAQGPWTDVYAAAAVMYHLITGKRPPESIDRLVNDEIKTPSELGIDIPKSVENALMNALNVKAENRTQSAQAFADALSGAVPVERVAVKKQKKESVKISTPSKIIISVLSVITIALVAVIVFATPRFTDGDGAKDVAPVLDNYEDMEKDDVFRALDELKEEYDFDYEIVGTVERDDLDEGDEIIVMQEPEAGTPLEEVDKVELKIAVPPVKKFKVPLLKGMTKKEAKKALEAAGIKKSKFVTKKSKEVASGRVFDQSVKAGKKCDENTTLTVYVAAPEETTKAQTTTKKRTTTTKKKSTTKKHTTTKKAATTKKKPTTKKHTTTKKATTTKKYISTTESTTRPQTTREPVIEEPDEED